MWYVLHQQQHKSYIYQLFVECKQLTSEYKSNKINTFLGEKDIHNDASNDKLIGSFQTECGIRLLPDFAEEKDTKDDHFDTKHYLHMEDEKNMPLQMCSTASFISPTITSTPRRTPSYLRYL